MLGRAHYRVAATLLAIFLVVPAISFSQQNSKQQPQAQKPDQDQPIRVQVQLVNLFATIRDGNRRLVPDVAREELRVLEEGQEQKIEFFRRETDLPLTLAILLDTSKSEENMLPIIQETAGRFLRRVLRPKDLATVLSFDADVNLLTDFTSDPERLQRALDRARINAPYSGINPGPLPPNLQGGGTILNDAIYLACTEKLSREAGRKALIVITDAYDSGSKVSQKLALETAQRTDAVIHVILVGDPRNYPMDPGAANKFASETGGRMLEPTSEKKFEEAFDQIAEELRSQYILGYTPANRARDGAFRKIKVESTRKGLKVLTRKGYYAPKS